MKFYIAARYAQKERIKNIYASLKEKGHEITADWSNQQSIKPYEEHVEQAKEYVMQDLQGVREADVVVLFAEYEVDARGCLIELGYAFRLWEETKKPHIYVIVESGSPSIFYFHPSVTFAKNMDEVLEDLKKKE